MSTAGDCITDRPASVPLYTEGNKDSLATRNIEDFLNRSAPVHAGDFESSSVTINEEVPIETQLSSEDDNEIGAHVETCSIPNFHTEASMLGSIPLENFDPNVVNDGLTTTGDVHLITENTMDKSVANLNLDDHVATPTITTRWRTPYENELSLENYQKNPPEFQLFSDKLNQLSATIQEKDELIQKLSHKLLELENRDIKSKGKSDRKSSTSSSSSERDTCTESIKKKKKNKTGKQLNEKEKVKKIKNTKPKDEKDKIEKDKDEEIKNEKKKSIIIQTEELFHSKNVSDQTNNEELIPDLRQKLNELEVEVKRLQQANVDSLLTLHHIQNKSPNDNNIDESVINQLLVDHSLLKEELEQLKWNHSKLSQPGLLGEEIKQLKKEVDALRNQNEILHQYVKSSSMKSLNHNSSPTVYRGSSDNLINEGKGSRSHTQRTFNNNSGSDYIYEKLHSVKRTTSGTPNVNTMLKHSIESLESPYRNTCQSIQYTIPFSDGETFRARKLSDSSSFLIEDTNPKLWLEPVSNNSKPIYKRTINDYNIPVLKRDHQDFDQVSDDSFISVTNSVTEAEEDNWKYPVKNIKSRHNDMDLLSTADSDTLVDSTDRDNYKRKPKYSYSFTPKSAVDLTLEDLVKFARPGGKMSTGRVCFVGHLPGRREVCVGLELDEDAGKHDGLFEGIRYFQWYFIILLAIIHCFINDYSRRNRGVFISFHKIILAYKSI